MKKLFLAIAAVLFGASWAFATPITILDSPNDAIGHPEFETYSIQINNFTPGVYSGAISFDIRTNYPQGGITVGSWATKPADLFITETYKGSQYQWAIPLVNHDSFTAGTMYAVNTFKISDQFEPPPGGGFIYNHGVPVQIESVGNNYGVSSLGGGSVTWEALSGNPNWVIHVLTGGVYEDDPKGAFNLQWWTATCGNDGIGGSTAVPEPATMLLLGSGLAGAGFFLRRKHPLKTE